MTTSGRSGALRNRLLPWAPGASQPRVPSPGDPAPLPTGARVLVIRPDHLGDVLFSGPALARLRGVWPGAHVTLLVGPWSRAIAERLPGADDVMTLDFPWFNRQPKGALWRPYTQLADAARSLRPRHFDAALILRDDDWWSAWLAALAGIPVRIGHDRPGVRAFLTHALPVGCAGPHVVTENLALIASLEEDAAPPDPALDRLAVRLNEADGAAADALLAGVPGQLVAVHPGSGATIKRWRSGAWAETLAAITQPDETVLLTGGPHEAMLTSALAAVADRPTLDLAGRTDVGTLAAVFARCRIVLGPDSGPLHLAVAVGTPTVHLFGPADATRFGPWGPADRHRVVSSHWPCAPCGRLDWPDPENHPCVRSVAVGAVVAAARSCATAGPAPIIGPSS